LAAKKTFEEYAEDLDRKEEEESKQYSFAELLEAAKKPVELMLPGFGKIKVGRLTVQDMLEMRDMDDPTNEIIYRMWSKFDDTVTREQIKELPAATREDFLVEAHKKAPFLSDMMLRFLQESRETGLSGVFSTSQESLISQQRRSSNGHHTG